jgi:anaerobic magnesium-protoporphyrin IX monomethyl ester cyclase
MARVLLVNPSHTYYGKAYRDSARGSVGLPVGILYIAAALEKKGCRVRVIDSLVSEFAVSRKVHDHTWYGIPPERWTKIIHEFRPDVVGISSQYTTQEENVFRMVDLIKTTDRSIPVIVGGANASCRADAILGGSQVDIAVRSEGEKIISEIIDFYNGGQKLESIGGISYRRGNEVLHNPAGSHEKNLDELPRPAYHLVNMESYLTLYQKGVYTRDRDVQRNIPMITSRGCPFSCIFCSISQSMGKAWRAHSAAYVINHLRELTRGYGVRHIHFEDDNLLFDLNRFVHIMGALREEHVTWDTPNGIRVDLSIGEDTLREMSRSGCKSLTIGVESGDEAILKNVVKKGIRLREVEEFARRCKKVGLPLRAFFVLGFPGETVETMSHTVDFAMRLLEKYDVEIINLIATPLFGTELFRICEKNGFFATDINPRTLAESTVSDGYGLIQTESFSPRDVEQLSRRFTAKVFRRLLLKGLGHPLRSAKRIGNVYVLKRTLRRIACLR